MGTITVCSFECYDASERTAGNKRRKVKKSLIAFMSNCGVVEGTDEIVDESRIDEDGFLLA